MSLVIYNFYRYIVPAKRLLLFVIVSSRFRLEQLQHRFAFISCQLDLNNRILSFIIQLNTAAVQRNKRRVTLVHHPPPTLSKDGFFHSGCHIHALCHGILNDASTGCLHRSQTRVVGRSLVILKAEHRSHRFANRRDDISLRTLSSGHDFLHTPPQSPTDAKSGPILPKAREQDQAPIPRGLGKQYSAKDLQSDIPLGHARRTGKCNSCSLTLL